MVFKHFLEVILKFEIEFIMKIQSISTGPENNLLLIQFCKIFTNEYHHTILTILVSFYKMILYFYQYDFRFIFIFIFVKEYIKLKMIFSFSKFINYKIKNLFQIKRPYVNNDNIEKITIKKDKSKSFSFPSNSVQKCIVFYYTILSSIQLNTINYFIVGSIVLMLSYIKTIRGLHYLHDIFSGILIGLLINYFYLNYMFNL